LTENDNDMSDMAEERRGSIKRLGVVMSPDPERLEEIEGVLNPGAARGPDGELYLFPRVVGKGNYSRIGIARVLFNEEGVPTGVERLGYALEPREPYELRPREGSGGCEDPRVTFVEPLGIYVMAYAAWGPPGPRLALAVSEDLLTWRRLGLVHFESEGVDSKYGVRFDDYDNKDGAFFPEVIVARDGRRALGMLHRPMYTTKEHAPQGVTDPRPSIWASFCLVDEAKEDINALTRLREHLMLIDPDHPWEHLRIGGGTPPVHTDLGMVMIYHGVSGTLARVPGEKNMVNYTAGVAVFDTSKPGYPISYRSHTPIFVPESEHETKGVVDNVVFPTGIDDRGNGVYDVYYGMADKYIGAVRCWLPASLPDV
jgi:predicted GH43/DUF377 family glycosyl hydrolase